MPDALVTALAHDGYQPIVLPRTGFTPPDLYTYSRGSPVALKPRARLLRHGTLADYIRGASAPVAFTPLRSKGPDIKGTHTSTKSARGSLDFLSKALGCLGVAALPKGKADISLGDSLMFSFEEVSSLRVDPSKIEAVLGSLDLSGIPRRQIESAGVHITYEYLYAKSLHMKRSDETKFSAGLTGEISEWLKLGDARVDVAIRDDLVITFTTKDDKEAAAFAYRSGQLDRQDEQYVLNLHIVRAGPNAVAQERYVPHPDGPLMVELTD
jgi:hypothetical protein